MLRLFSRRFFNFRIKNKKISFIFFVLSSFIITYFLLKQSNSLYLVKSKIFPSLDVVCTKHNIKFDEVFLQHQSIPFHNLSCISDVQKKTRILLILSSSSKNPHHLEIILESLKINFDKVVLKDMDQIDISNVSYSLLVIENLLAFYNQETSAVRRILEYCRQNNIAIISGASFVDSSVTTTRIGNLPLYLLSGLPLYNFYVTDYPSILYFTKNSVYINEIFEGIKWSFLLPLRKGFEIIAFSEDKNKFYFKKSDLFNTTMNGLVSYKPIVIKDFGLYDGITKVIFSTDMSYWMNIVIFMDALKITCNLDSDLTRFIQIDIDDIFVGKTGSRMIQDDVDSLIKYQKLWSSNFVDDFKFNLGFSGYYFKSGNVQESESDEYLIKNKNLFNWFPHMWSHKKPHLLTEDKLSEEFQNNIEFSKQFQLNTSLNYAIAPFHSGVYPIYDVLYDLWKALWNISVTSTEEYPKLNPSRSRRGFVYKNISVLPRQTCGIYTHTLYLNKYPRGKSYLNKSILGGSLFLTVLYTKVSIFMTHFSNYGSDRLGTYTFDSLFRFIKCFTNLKLIQKTPYQLANIYFSKLPSEKAPIWYNPCSYKRHKFLLPITYSCSSLPKFIIVGPQKTASTALHKFLNLHPEISSNIQLSDTFEEPQFFSNSKYMKGVEWYMNLFPNNSNQSTVVYFEKSATYFDNPATPELMHNLLPDIKIIVLLMNPIYRAYSWYQHMIAHHDETALKYTFHQIVTSENSSDVNLLKLRNRCLNPGLYFNHLKNWIQFYSPNNIILLDSDQLRRNPISLMNGLQLLLPVTSKIDYSDHLIFSDKKGFYCAKSSVGEGKKISCLGAGKGRHYEEMQNDTFDYLRQYYLPHNKKLIKLLQFYRYSSFPQWLTE